MLTHHVNNHANGAIVNKNTLQDHVTENAQSNTVEYSIFPSKPACQKGIRPKPWGGVLKDCCKFVHHPWKTADFSCQHSAGTEHLGSENTRFMKIYGT